MTLQEQVARAMRAARGERQYHATIRGGVHDGEGWRDVRYQRLETQEEIDARVADAAIRVVLAEAQAAIAACPRRGANDAFVYRENALSVLAGLAWSA